MGIDFLVFDKKSLELNEVAKDSFDIFFSAYNSSGRVKSMFGKVKAAKKIWILHPEYGFSDAEVVKISRINVYDVVNLSKIQDFIAYVDKIGDLTNLKLCIDITGFMRPALVNFLIVLMKKNVKMIDCIYSEPNRYANHDDTVFSEKSSGNLEYISGAYNKISSEKSDILIMSIGYDQKLISEMVHRKDDAEVYPIFAFPSLSADMYQQSAVRASKSGEVTEKRDWICNRSFAPANDPFATAKIIQDIVLRDNLADTNIYLCPLSTKAQVLGFFLYWCLEGQFSSRNGYSIVFPECLSYKRSTSSGFGKIWMYKIELSL